MSPRCIGCALLSVLLLSGGCEPPPAEPEAELSFRRVVIDPEPPERPWYKMLGDLDQDGLIDVVVAGARNSLVVYRAPNWVKTEIAAEGWDGVSGEIGDIDGDGDPDIVMGGVLWLANPGSVNAPWKPTVIDDLKAHEIELADMNGDGNIDVVARDQSAFGAPETGALLHVYMQQTPYAWPHDSLPCPPGEGVKVADLDRDGDSDIVIAGRWYANHNGARRWTEHIYAPDWAEPDAKVEVADINGDGRPDVVLALAELKGDRYRIAWFEAPENPAGGEWTEHVVAADIETVVHALGVGDLDLDGDADIAYAEMHQGEDPDEVVVMRNGNAGAEWRKQVLSTEGSHDIALGDIGGDGDIDILGANHAGDNQAIILWENLTR